MFSNSSPNLLNELKIRAGELSASPLRTTIKAGATALPTPSSRGEKEDAPKAGRVPHDN
jgi:hypothetical protein